MTASPGAEFLRRLPPRFQPAPAAVARLAPMVDQLLAGDYTAATLLARLTAGIDSEYSPAAAIVRRVEKLAAELRKGSPPPRPSWCGECDEHTRMREMPGTGQPYRCPHCHPRSVASPPAAS